MSSIVGYIGKRLSRTIIIEALQHLEYRGYDSAGFACIPSHNNNILYSKTLADLSELRRNCEYNSIDGVLGIGHLRLATHGKVSEENIHPHFDCEKKVAVVHNGIIENHQLLKEQLEKTGHTFHSTTDSEVIAHLLKDALSTHNNCKDATFDLLERLQGAYAFAAISQNFPDVMIVVRKRSPLYIGSGDGEVVVSSSLSAFAGITDNIAIMPDESFALIQRNSIDIYNSSGKVLPLYVQKMNVALQSCERGNYDHYMLKEIYEQKNSIHQTLEFLKMISPNIGEYVGISAEQAQQLERIHLIGSGSSWHAARIAQFFFEHITHLPTQVSLSSEFRFMPLLPTDRTIYIMLSQSGETADTLEALRLLNSMNLPTLGLTNETSSTLIREADGFLLTQAGHEHAAASTKSFTTQLAALYWFAHRLALEKSIIDETIMKTSEANLLVAAEVLENSIENYKLDIEQKYAKQYAQYQNIMFLGRHISYPFALEAALKLKKISYMSVECYPAGELKHGPLAGIDGSRTIFIFSHQDPSIYQKLLSNAQEIKARGGNLISFIFEGQSELKSLSDHAFVIPSVKQLLEPIAMAGLMQFFIYQIAKELNCPIDKPRNISKTCDY